MKKDWFKSIPKSILVICLIIALLVVVGVIAWKPLRVLNLQARAGGKIEDYIQTYAPDFENYFTCQIPALTTLPEDERLEQAIELLETARGKRPQNAQTNLLLGRAYCLQEDYFGAFNAFDAFSQARPDNPLGALETAFAHFTLALTEDNIPESERIAYETQSRLILEGLGLSSEYFIDEGDAAFFHSSSPIAWYWYRLGDIFQPLPEETAFRISLLEFVSRQETSFTDHLNDDFILTLEDSLRIPPSAFFRLADGTPVYIQEIGGELVGMYSRNRDPGGTFINVQNSGHYCISVQAFDRPPATTIIEMTLDLEQVTMLELPNGDDTWRTFETDLFLEEGLHLLGFRLTNDANVDGVDRNGHVGEIVIHRCHE